MDSSWKKYHALCFHFLFLCLVSSENLVTMDKAFNKNWHETQFGSHPEVFLKKGVLKICRKFTGEHRCGSVISRKLLCNFIEIALQHRCSPVNSPLGGFWWWFKVSLSLSQWSPIRLYNVIEKNHTSTSCSK